MRLTTQTDYALRILMYLAACPGRARAADVSALFQISSHHIAKVVNLLARLGYVRSVRGIGGGIELARDPARVLVGEVIAAVEGRLQLLDCVTTDNVCVIERHCKLKNVLAEAERVQMDYLNGVTLADVVPTKRQMEHPG